MDNKNEHKKKISEKNNSYACNLFKIEGIANKTIVNFFAEKASDDIKKN